MSFWRRLGGLGARSPRPTSTHRCSRSAPVCMASPPPAASKRLNFRGFLNPLYLFHVPFISSLVLLSFFGRKMPGGAQKVSQNAGRGAAADEKCPKMPGRARRQAKCGGGGRQAETLQPEVSMGSKKSKISQKVSISHENVEFFIFSTFWKNSILGHKNP